MENEKLQKVIKNLSSDINHYLLIFEHNRESFVDQNFEFYEVFGTIIEYIAGNDKRINKAYNVLMEGNMQKYFSSILRINLSSKSAPVYLILCKPSNLDYVSDKLQTDFLTREIEYSEYISDSNERSHNTACDTVLEYINNMIEDSNCEEYGIKWEEAKLFREYHREKTTWRKLSDKYDIPLSSLYGIYSSALKKIRKHLKDNNINLYD